jgi:three-Cys-motif partner protein
LAGTGQARGAQGEALSGSSLSFLEEIGKHAERLANREMRIHIKMIEQKPERIALLRQRVSEFLAANGEVDHLVRVTYASCDVNQAVDSMSLQVSKKNPCFLFVDPFGLEVTGATVSKLVGLPWSVDVLFNYMLEAVQRVHGVARGSSNRAGANSRTLDAFFGLGTSDLGSSEIQDPATYA